MAYWGNNPHWTRLPDRDKAVLMALLEADLKGGRIDVDSARNALGAMINRAAKEGVPIGEHVSGKIYQPTIEDAQFARLARLMGSPEHKQLSQAYDDRVSGRAPDWVGGATHFLAPEQTMLALEASNPQKYRSWRQWTGFDPDSRQYAGVMMRDGSHAFLAPEGAYSAQFGAGATPDASMPTSPPAAPQRPHTAPQTMLASAGSGAGTTPTQATGMLASLFGSDGSGGLLGDLADPAGAQAAMQSAASGDDVPMAPAVMPQQRGPVDVQRLIAVLQSRGRLGTA